MLRPVHLIAAALVLCLPVAAAAQCEGITVEQDGLFLIINHDAEYNCAVYTIGHQVELDGSVLNVTELATADAWADCYCPYFSKVVVGGLPAGDYTLHYAYTETVENEEPLPWTWCELPFTITDAGLDQDQIMVQTSASGCGIPVTAVPDDPQPGGPITWSALKARFD
jgi:hypothetical protein